MRARLVTQLGGAAAVLVALLAAGGGVLGTVPLTHPSRMGEWWADAGPLVGAFSLLRFAAIAMAGYWTLLSVALISLPPAGLPGSRRRRRRLRAPGARWMLRVAAGTSAAGLAVTCCAGGSSAWADTSPPPGPSAPPAAEAQPPEAPRLVPLLPAPTPTPLPLLPSPPVPAQPAPVRGQPPPARDQSIRTWTVRPGDDLWSIAEDVVQSIDGRRPSTHEIAAYWLRVVDDNRPYLPDPENPSLIFPGDVIRLPAP